MLLRTIACNHNNEFLMIIHMHTLINQAINTLNGHVHNVSAYSRMSVNARGVANVGNTVCTYDPGQSTFPC